MLCWLEDEFGSFESSTCKFAPGHNDAYFLQVRTVFNDTRHSMSISLGVHPGTAIVAMARVRSAGTEAHYREGDYADPHTSEESPRIMARRRGRRARRPRPSDSEVEGGADGAAPLESSKASPSHLGATYGHATVHIAGGRQHRRH